LEKVEFKDESILGGLSRENILKKLFDELKKQVVMPTNQYISLGKEYLSQQVFKTIYYNKNDKILGCYYTRSSWNDDEHYPNLILLPQFSDNCIVIQKALKALAKINKNILPELYESDWISSERFYPKEVSDHDKEVESLIQETRKKLGEIEQRKNKAKENFESVKGLLYRSGNELKENVINVLKTAFGINARDADKEKVGALSNEDLIIEIDKRRILAEVKGVNAEYPSPLFIGQVWKHLAQCKDKEITEGALILNYDLKTEPDERKLAYTGELEESLNDIIFIDTRVMYNLAIAVIDYGLPRGDAARLLFQKGRVSFDLKKYSEKR